MMMIYAWPLLALTEFALSVLAVGLSPLLAMCSVTLANHKYCSAPGPREYLPGWLHLFATHDDGIDAGWYMGLYDDRAPAGWPKMARNGSKVARWHLRMWWILRNSGYGFAHFVLGFDRSAGYTTRYLLQRGKWDSDTTNYSLRVDTNADGRKAFELRGQFFYSRTRYVRVYLGWKLSWAAPRVQIATHINPFRTWKPQE